MPSRFLVIAAAVFLVGCGDDSTEPLVPTTLELDPQELTVEVQQEAAVNARVLDQHGTEISGAAVEWFASNPSVARVENGAVTGVTPGTATITAEAEGVSADVAVTVEPRELSAELAFDYDGGHTGSFDVSQTFRLEITGQPDPHDWAVTFYFNEFESQDIVAERVREDGFLDLVWFWVDTEIGGTGTHDLDGAFIFFGIQDPQTYEFAYEEMDEGTITFSSVTADRLEGTFSFDLVAETGETLDVTEGSFDVPRVDEAEIGITSSSAAFPGHAFASPAELRRALLERARAPR